MLTMKTHTLINAMVILASAVTLLVPRAVFAQSPPAEGDRETLPSWEDLGLDNLPEGYSTDGIALIDGLNKIR